MRSRYQPGPELFQRWVHVREEDEPGVAVYRPAGYPIPADGCRDGLEFRRDGTVIRYAPGPAGDAVGTPATWRATGPDALSVIGTDQGTAAFVIDALDADLLRLRIGKH